MAELAASYITREVAMIVAPGGSPAALLTNLYLTRRSIASA